ncbi:MAG TPA: M20/M25/M40 family metallo-hydrolase [Anaerolineales bacterium]
MTAMISTQDAQYALDLVRSICEEVGPGFPGSSQERERAFRFRRELEAHLGAENVAVEEFTVAPWAWLGSFPVGALLTLFAALLNMFIGYFPSRFPEFIYWIAGTISLASSILAVVLLIYEYIRYIEVIDPFFKKTQSLNIIGSLRRPGTKQVKRLLILSGHHDSAWENTWIGLFGYGLYVVIPAIFFGYIAMTVASLIQLAGQVTVNAGIIRFGTLGWPVLVFLIAPCIIFAFFFNRGKKNGGTVPGAADNLSACAIVAAACRFLVRNPEYIPEDTEIRFISFGCEEAGLRGSRRYVERHLDELKQLDARLLNYETVASPEIGIMTTDVDGMKLSPEMVKSTAAAAERAGVPYAVKPSPTGAGGSDAGSFSQAGIKAVSLLPMQVPQQLVAFYHQKRDTPGVLTIDPLVNVLKLTIEWIRCSEDSWGQPRIFRE